MCVFSPQIYNEIHHGFLEAGCDVKDLFIGEEFIKRPDLLEAALSSALDEFRPDFVYSYGWWKDIADIDAFLDIIKRRGIFHVWWSADDPTCFGLASLPPAKRSDLVFTPVEELIPEYAKYGVKAYLQPNACSPHHIKLPPKAEYLHDMALVANNYSMRYVDEETKRSIHYKFRVEGIYQTLKPLVDARKDVKVWGRWWTDFDRAYMLPTAFYGGVLPTEEVPYVYASAKIALGIQQVGVSQTYVSSRTYEALGCGAFHITQYSPGVENYFKKGVHLEWSRSPEETLELANFYLAHDSLREAIALNGQREVDEKHRLIHRAQSVLAVILQYIPK
ncbi:Spore maturation protein CgeB [Sporobacter termitidis DSM 10068]|uniref:Spore maturation protein CgeB n=2 Tax=Sporobacter TaxID=44748 RepID=A0A1M5UAB1_9FIRM|nr:Spore maturation protein CgeB [Sporobacter termitidis DSM 10068]